MNEMYAPSRLNAIDTGITPGSVPSVALPTHQYNPHNIRNKRLLEVHG